MLAAERYLNRVLPQLFATICSWQTRLRPYKCCALQASKWSSDDLYRHAAFCEEWLFRVCAPEPLPLGSRLEVVDLKGMRFTDIGSGWFGW
jgi:hypothetical protein